jgi:UDP-glucose 4-epimerase
MRILVTGSSGRVGRAIYVRLGREHEVTGLDRSPSSTSDFIGSLSDPVLLRKALHKVDAVIHTAALHAPHVGLSTDSEFESINVQSTRQLAESAAESGVGKFIFTSTTALYGAASTPTEEAGWVNEALEPQPETIYHKTKIAAENFLQTFSQQYSIPIMAAYRLHRGVDARDVADAHALAVESALPGFRRYIISGATPFCKMDTKAILTDAPSVLEQRAPDLVLAFARRGWALPSTIDRVYSSALATDELGWTPKYGFMEVLKMYDEQSSEVLPPRQIWHTKE